MSRKLTLTFAACLTVSISAIAFPKEGTRLHYNVFSGRNDLPPPFATVDFVYGPTEGTKNFRWWQLEVRAKTNLDSQPLLIIRGLTDADPLAKKQHPLEFARYQLRIPDTGETYDYRDTTGHALLPCWENFEHYFVPHPAVNSGRKNGAPETCEYLGQLLSLGKPVIRVPDSQWKWPNVKILNLNREVMIGNDRNFKDSEGHRLPADSTNDYTYIPLTEDDYKTAIAAGMNMFEIEPHQEKWLRSEPVFYLHEAGGEPRLRYPVDLYRANYLGPVMFIDEPAGMILDQDDRRRTGKFPADFSTLFEMRTRATRVSTTYYGATYLETGLRNAGVNFGDMRLVQTDYPTWDSYAEASYYEMRAGVSGIVQEGRYHVSGFDAAAFAATGQKWNYTPLQELKFNFSMMRGGTRPFGKFWGTSIYGQCDPDVAPLALTTAYDMGARYFWFWTSDHRHHLPWTEQMALARTLKDYAATHPRSSVFAPPPKRDAVVAIPNGYFLSLRDFYWNTGEDLERQAAGEKYRRVLTRALQAVHDCFDRGEDFDITVNDGHRIEGYRHVIIIDEPDKR